MKVAIELFHGRTSPDEQLENWGSQGPLFLVDYVHVTYAGDLKLGLPEPAGDGDLHHVGDLLFYGGIYYGDWSVFPEELVHKDQDLKARLAPFDPALAARPATTVPEPSVHSTKEMQP